MALHSEIEMQQKYNGIGEMSEIRVEEDDE